MGYLILAGFLLAAAFITVLVSGRLARLGEPSREYREDNATYEARRAQFRDTAGKAGTIVGWGIALVILAFLGVFTAIRSVHQIDARNAGVVRTFGAITGQTGEGLVLTWPWQSVEEWEVREQQIVMDLAVGSKDGQAVSLKLILNIDVQPGDIQGLAREVGPNYIERVIKPRTAQAVKELTSKHPGLDIFLKRDQIRVEAEQRLSQEFAVYSVGVKSVILENIDYSDQFNAAIEAKVAAEEQAKAEINKVQIAKAQADQAIEAARGVAESEIEKARGTAEANRQIAQSLTAALIQFQAIQKLAPTINTILVPSDSGFILPPELLNPPAR